jgi:cytochrome c peroxidase
MQGGGKLFVMLGAGAGLYYAKEQGLLDGFLGMPSSSANKIPTNADYDKVRKAVADLLESNPEYDDGSYGPLLVRLAWHTSVSYYFTCFF